MIAFTSIVLNSDGTWTFSWAADGSAFYRAVLEGVVLAGNVLTTSYVWSGQGYPKFPPPLEIAHENLPVLSELYQPYFVIQWYAVPGAARYVVQQFDGAAWATIASVVETGAWLYAYQCLTRPDGTLLQWRVLAEDSLGYQSPPLSFNRLVVTPPAPPDTATALTYSGGNINVVPN